MIYSLERVGDRMKTVTTAAEIQSLILPIMKYIDEVCREHNLRYSLSYGTLLGAVRHENFIPWDDDLDIIMPRPDFDKLLELLRQDIKEGLGLLDTYDLDNFYALKMAKVYDKNTILREYPKKYNLEYGVYVDIFPVEGLPSDMGAIKAYYKEYRVYKRWMYYYTSCKYLKKGFRKKLTSIARIFGKNTLEAANTFFHRYHFDEAQYVGVLVSDGTIKKELLYKTDFDHLKDYTFGPYKFKGLAEPHRFLTNLYGDYMTLPPESERGRRHDTEIYIP